MLGRVAGAPAILGAFIGASAFAALWIGIGSPPSATAAGRALYPASAGVAVLYLTGLLLST